MMTNPNEIESLHSALGEAERYAKELEARLAEREWRPIDTAPKDVTVVLLYRYRRGSLSWSICYWDAEQCDWVKYDSPDSSFTDPTHWMPLPEPPST